MPLAYAAYELFIVSSTIRLTQQFQLQTGILYKHGIYSLARFNLNKSENNINIHWEYLNKSIYENSRGFK